MRTPEERTEAGRAANRAWRRKNPTRVRDKNAEWRAANPGVAIELHHKARSTPLGRAGKMLSSAKIRAKSVGVPCTVTKEWIADRLVTPCPLTGLDFDWTPASPLTPSLDRIVPSLGYTPENSRIIILGVNLAKGRWDDAQLYHWAEALIKHRGTLH